MRYIAIIIIFLLTACSNSPAKRDGGGADFTHTTTTVTKYNESVPVESTEVATTNIILKQPENPKEGGALVIKKGNKGDIAIGVDTSGTLDTDSAIAAISGLSPVTYSGIGLIVLGMGIGILTKGRQLLPAAGMGITGVFLIALAFLMPTYPHIFLIGIVATVLAVVGYIFYTARSFFKTDRALDETINTVDVIKPVLDPQVKQEIFKSNSPKVNNIQSKCTRKLIDQKRIKHRYE